MSSRFPAIRDSVALEQRLTSEITRAEDEERKSVEGGWRGRGKERETSRKTSRKRGEAERNRVSKDTILRLRGRRWWLGGVKGTLLAKRGELCRRKRADSTRLVQVR